MYYRELGQSGIMASSVAMGVMRMGGIEQKAATEAVKTALDAGIDFFDSADIYGMGESSRKLGCALRELGVARDRVVLQTKFGISPDPTGARQGVYDFSHDHLMRALESELTALQTDYVDFLLLHRLDTLCDLNELHDTMGEIVSSGLARHIGVSNMGPWTCELLQQHLDSKLEVNQLQFGLCAAGMVKMQLHENMADDDAADRDGGVLAYSQLRNMTIQAWSPLQFGTFAGTFLDNPEFPELNAELERVAQAHGVSKDTIATAWILRHPARMQVIAGTMNPEHIRSTAAAADVELSRQEWYDLYRAAGNDLP